MNTFAILGIAALAAVASVAGGAIALVRKPTSLFMSGALGFASGVLLATIGFEMLPRAAELADIGWTVVGFVMGFASVYALDLYVHRGKLAGDESEKRPQVERFYQSRRPHGGEVTVLAVGTSAEELIEGLAIGVGAAITPGTGILVALAILIDNVSEGLSIGEIVRSERSAPDQHARRILGWTGLVGGALFVSAAAGWFLLRGLPEAVLGVLFAAGGGGMFYLTVTDLIPEAEERHYQQSAAIAMSVGFVAIFLLAELV